MLGQHARAPAAAVLYVASVALASAASAASWWYASGTGRLVSPDAAGTQIKVLRARSLSAPVFFALTLPAAAFVPYAAGAL